MPTDLLNISYETSMCSIYDFEPHVRWSHLCK